MATLKIKEGDTVAWTGTVSHGSTGAPLAGASSLKLYGRRANHSGPSTPNQIDGVEVDSFSTSTSATWTFTPSTGHVETGGKPVKLHIYLLATYAGGATARFPSEGYGIVQLSENYE